jgi:hypothetical protein
MKRKVQVLAMMAGLAATALVGIPPAAASTQTDITYQGELRQAGNPFDGQANMTFRLFADETGGSPLQIVAPPTPVAVVDGRFTVHLVFDQAHFGGAERWLETTVEEVGVPGVITLAPRKPITSAPYALYAMNAHGPSITGINAANISGGTLGDPYLSTNVAMRNAANTFTAPNTFSQALTLSAQGTATTHAVRADRAIATSGGLTGGGNLTANRTISVADGGITTARLADGSVTATKLATSSVITAKIANLAVTDAKIGGVDWGKVSNAPNFLTVEADPSWLGVASTSSNIGRTGNVGIGTTSPVQPLHVVGTTRVSTLAGTGTRVVQANPSGDLLFLSSGSTSQFLRGDGTWAAPTVSESDPTWSGAANTTGTISRTGNVGIGTTNPTVRLEVAGGILASTGDIPVQGIRTGTTGTWPGVHGETHSSATSSAGVRGFATAASGSTRGVWGEVTSPTGYAGYFTGGRNYFEGDVGIGTTDPTAKLHVAGGILAASVRGFATGATGPTRGVWGEVVSPTGYAGYFSGGRNYFEGRVGIGNTNPNTQLNVNAPAGEDPLRVQIGGQTRFFVGSNGGASVGVFGTAPDLGLRVQGNVAIGRATADYPLHATSPASHLGPTIYADHPAVYSDNAAIAGSNTNSDTWGVGVLGVAAHIGVRGIGTIADGGTNNMTRIGVRGEAGVVGVVNYGVYGLAGNGNWRYGVYGTASSTVTESWAGYFAGRAHVTSTLSKGAGTFKIDHPLDPENKYLYHSFVESPDMMNIYNGNVITDHNGFATITMPDWFNALNRDFRYQLTVINEGNEYEFVLVQVVRRMQDGQFSIRTSHPHTEVSWQVTGIRQDAFAEANRVQVEVEKAPEDRGHYLHPEAFGQPAEKGIDWKHTPEAQEQQRAALLAGE